MAGKKVKKAPRVMDRFDELLLRAAEKKRKEIIDLHGYDGCTKLLAKGGKTKKEDPEVIREKYESTIRNLLEGWEMTPTSVDTSVKDDAHTAQHAEKDDSGDFGSAELTSPVKADARTAQPAKKIKNFEAWETTPRGSKKKIKKFDDIIDTKNRVEAWETTPGGNKKKIKNFGACYTTPKRGGKKKIKKFNDIIDTKILLEAGERTPVLVDIEKKIKNVEACSTTPRGSKKKLKNDTKILLEARETTPVGSEKKIKILEAWETTPGGNKKKTKKVDDIIDTKILLKPGEISPMGSYSTPVGSKKKIKNLGACYSAPVGSKKKIKNLEAWETTPGGSKKKTKNVNDAIDKTWQWNLAKAAAAAVKRKKNRGLTKLTNDKGGLQSNQHSTNDTSERDNQESKQGKTHRGRNRETMENSTKERRRAASEGRIRDKKKGRNDRSESSDGGKRDKKKGERHSSNERQSPSFQEEGTMELAGDESWETEGMMELEGTMELSGHFYPEQDRRRQRSKEKQEYSIRENGSVLTADTAELTADSRTERAIEGVKLQIKERKKHKKKRASLPGRKKRPMDEKQKVTGVKQAVDLWERRSSSNLKARRASFC